MGSGEAEENRQLKGLLLAHHEGGISDRKVYHSSRRDSCETVNQKRERGTVSSSPSQVFVVSALAASAGRCQGAHRKSGVVIRRSYAFHVESVIPPFLLACLPSTPVQAQMQDLLSSYCINNANAFRPSLSAHALPRHQRLTKRKTPNSVGRSCSRQGEWLGGAKTKGTSNEPEAPPAPSVDGEHFQTSIPIICIRPSPFKVESYYFVAKPGKYRSPLG